MMTQVVQDRLSAARAALAERADFEAVLVKLGPKGRVNAEKHLAACEVIGPPERGQLWKRMVCSLMTLSPHFVKMNREENLQFYVADGRFKKQVLAIEDLRQDALTLYCTDVLDAAIESGLLRRSPATIGVSRYEVADSGESLVIDRLDGKSLNPAMFFKDMMGWNRKALRIALPLSASEVQIEAVEALCAMSMHGIPNNPPPPMHHNVRS